MAANPNQYSGQARYSRDVCDLMQRINALEARASLGPSTGFSIALDFDVMDGRVYVLVRESTTGYRIKVHDATNGAPLYDFAVPFAMQASSGGGQTIEYNAAPRLCCGGGYIYMPGAYRHTGDTPSTPVGGGIWRFTAQGDEAIFTPFPKGEDTTGIYDVVSSDWYFAGGGTQVPDHDDAPIEVEYSLGWGSQQTTLPSAKMQMHYVDGIVYGIAVRITGPADLSIEGFLTATANTSDSTRTYPPRETTRYMTQICYALGDLSRLGWAHTEVIEKRGDDKERLEQTGTFSPGPDGPNGIYPYLLHKSPPFPNQWPGEVSDAFIAHVQTYQETFFAGVPTPDFEYDYVVEIFGVQSVTHYGPWQMAQAWSTDYPQDHAFPNDLTGSGGQRLSHNVTREYTSTRSPVHALSVGALAVHDGELYFDGGNEQVAVGATIPASEFVKMPADGADIAQPELVHKGKLTPFATASGRYSHAWLYATDGTYLFAVEGYNPKQLNRYMLLAGTLVDEWEDLNPNQIRVIDGLLWLSYPAEVDQDLLTPVQSKIEVRDPATMAIVLEFYVGDPLAQTEWVSYQTGQTTTSLGEPDGGVTVPALEALVGASNLVAPELIFDMRRALERIVGFFRAPSGERLHLSGAADANNLYWLAMGDRTKYGATGGATYGWTRDSDDMDATDNVTVGGSEHGATYFCIRDHVSSESTKPGVGAQWTNYWAAGAIEGTQENPPEWIPGLRYATRKTYDIDIGEILECVTRLEGSSLMGEP